jgi:hypothetical protein
MRAVRSVPQDEGNFDRTSAVVQEVGVMSLMDNLSRRDSLLDALERTLEESRRLRGQILGTTIQPSADLEETARDLRRTSAPALTWPLPL